MADEKDKDVDLDKDNDVDIDDDKDLDTEVDYKDLAAKNAAEAAKWKSIAKRNREKRPPITNDSKESIDEETKQTVSRLSLAEEKRQYGYEHKLSPRETDYAFKFANGKPNKETLEEPFFKGGLEKLREAERVDNNTPSPSSGGMMYNGKAFADLDLDERRKAHNERFSKARTK